MRLIGRIGCSNPGCAVKNRNWNCGSDFLDLLPVRVGHRKKQWRDTAETAATAATAASNQREQVFLHCSVIWELWYDSFV